MDRRDEPPSPLGGGTPGTPSHVDEKAVRDELTRQFSVCVECRRCTDLCVAFPTLFELVDATVDGHPGRLTPHQQDEVVGACHQCNLCAVECPYSPDRSELAVDVPRLMLRTRAMHRANGQQPWRRRLAVAVAEPPIPALLARAAPGSTIRRLGAAASGVSAVRFLPRRAHERFTSWFHARTDRPHEPTAIRVTVVPTCHVEHHVPEIGRDLVDLYEHLGVACGLGDVVCCGAPQLHSGDLEGFTKTAERNVERLAGSLRDGARAIVVPQPTCAHVLAIDTPRVIGSAEADRVAEAVRDACELLDELAAAGDVDVDAESARVAARGVVLHVSCHARARHAELPVERLLARLGVAIRRVERCAGTVDTRGLRAEHEEAALEQARSLGRATERALADADDGEADVVVIGECALANLAIEEQTDRRPIHPIELVHRLLRGR